MEAPGAVVSPEQTSPSVEQVRNWLDRFWLEVCLPRLHVVILIIITCATKEVLHGPEGLKLVVRILKIQACRIHAFKSISVLHSVAVFVKASRRPTIVVLSSSGLQRHVADQIQDKCIMTTTCRRLSLLPRTQQPHSSP